jgi:deazaflavin-dependent oxidoreductase (nitroreductase family)
VSTPTRHVSPLNRLVHSFGATATGAWFFSRVARPLDMLVLKLSGNRHTLTAMLAGLPMLALDTVGAKSGLLRRVPLVGLEHPDYPDAFAVIGSNFGRAQGPAWMANLRAHPNVTAHVRGRARHFCARELTGADYETFWRLAQRVYPGYASYKRRAGERRIAIMLLERVAAAKAV